MIKIQLLLSLFFFRINHFCTLKLYLHVFVLPEDKLKTVFQKLSTNLCVCQRSTTIHLYPCHGIEFSYILCVLEEGKPDHTVFVHSF